MMSYSTRLGRPASYAQSLLLKARSEFAELAGTPDIVELWVTDAGFKANYVVVDWLFLELSDLGIWRFWADRVNMFERAEGGFG